MRNHSPSCRPSRGGIGIVLNEGQLRWAENWLRETRDEDLALFQDVRSEERKNFLHPSNDDLESSLSMKVGGLTGLRTPVSSGTPPRKVNDLLQTDLEKNDYDWLLTPPGTPLFPSLDGDTPLLQPKHSSLQIGSASKVPRLLNGREMHHRVSHGNSSPRSTSSSSSFSNANSTMKGRASSPCRRPASPQRPSTPSRPLGRALTTLNRASTRSSPPVLRRMNTSPTVRSSSTDRSVPKGRVRGTSASPKLQTWQQQEIEFSLDPPPNLRTSVSDRPTTLRNAQNRSEARHSYSEMVDVSRTKWHSSSSSTSRISISSNSQDRWTSKGSFISSSDDGTDLSQPSFIDYSPVSVSSTPGDTNIVLNGVKGSYHPSSSKRSIKSTALSGETTGLPSATARKSLEASMRRVDHQHVPQNMFRPLLSSAPAPSFYNAQFRPVSPVLEPSISNASSEQGVMIFPGDDSSDDEIKSKWNNSLFGATVLKAMPDDPCDTNPACINTDNSSMDRFGQDGVTHSFSSPMHPVHSFECDNSSIGTHKPLEWSQHTVLQHNAKYTGEVEGSFETESPKNQSLAEENPFTKDFQQEVDILICNQSAEDHAVADFQENNLLHCTTNLLRNVELQESLHSCNRTENQDLDNIYVGDETNTVAIHEEQAISKIVKLEDQVTQERKSGFNMLSDQQLPCSIEEIDTCSNIKPEIQSNLTDAASSEIVEPFVPCDMEVGMGTCFDPEYEMESNSRYTRASETIESSSPHQVIDGHQMSISEKESSALPSDFAGVTTLPSLQEPVREQFLKSLPCPHYHLEGEEELKQVNEGQHGFLMEMNKGRDASDSSADHPVQLNITAEESSEDYDNILTSTDCLVNEVIERDRHICQEKPFLDVDGSWYNATECQDFLLTGNLGCLEASTSAVEDMCKEDMSTCNESEEHIDVTGTGTSISTAIAAYSNTLSDTPTAIGEASQDPVCQHKNLKLESMPKENFLEEIDRDEKQDGVVNLHLEASKGEDSGIISMGMREQSLQLTIMQTSRPCHDETEHDFEECRHTSQSFSLEEATNTILFCSSIVHDIIYKAATIAYEKEQCIKQKVLPQPKNPIWSSSYKSPLKMKILKTKARPKEAVQSVQPDKEAVTNKVIFMEPPVIDSMKIDQLGTKSADNRKEKSCFKVISSGSTNCRCTVM